MLSYKYSVISMLLFKKKKNKKQIHKKNNPKQKHPAGITVTDSLNWGMVFTQ